MYNVHVTVNEASAINKHNDCGGLVKEMNLHMIFNYEFEATLSPNDTLFKLHHYLENKYFDHIIKSLDSNINLYASSFFKRVPYNLKMFILKRLKSIKSETIKLCFVLVSQEGELMEMKSHSSQTVSNIEKDYRWPWISNCNDYTNINNKNKYNKICKFKLKLLVLSDVVADLLWLGFINKIPSHGNHCNASKFNHRNTYDTKLQLISYDSIEWNDFDMSIYNCWVVVVKLDSIHHDYDNIDYNIMYIYHRILTCLLSCMTELDEQLNQQGKNCHVGDNTNSNVQLQLDILWLVQTADYLIKHLLFYTFPLFQLKYSNSYWWILHAWTKCYSYYFKYKNNPKYKQWHVHNLELYPPHSYNLLILEKMLTWHNKSVAVGLGFKRQYIDIANYDSTSGLLLSNLSKMNQMCLIIASNNKNYSFTEMARYLHYFLKVYTNENKQILHYDSNVYDVLSSMHGINYLDKTKQIIQTILSLIIIALSFCNTLSNNGNSKIGIILREIDSNYVKYSAKMYSQFTISPKNIKIMILYCIALVIFKLKFMTKTNYSINCYFVNYNYNIHFSQKQVERKQIKLLLFQLNLAHYIYKQTKNSCSVWNEWPQIHDYMKWIEFLSNSMPNNDNNDNDNEINKDNTNNDIHNGSCNDHDVNITQIRKLRQLPQRVQSVYDKFSMFSQSRRRKDRKNGKYNESRNELDKVCAKLGFGQYETAKKGRYRKMLRLCRNASQKQKCSNDKCRCVIKKLRRCSNCKNTFYCSKRCQKMDWKKHVNTCVYNKIEHVDV